MTPEQIAHRVAGDWIMGPINMGDLEHRIADVVRHERARADIMADALMRISASQDIEVIHKISRAAQVKATGEQ